MDQIQAIFQDHIYSLWLGEWRRNKLTVCLWVRTDECGKSAKPAPLYLVEHPILVTEFQECKQMECTLVDPSEVSLKRLADTGDYEQYLIINCTEVNTFKALSRTEKNLQKTKQNEDY